MKYAIDCEFIDTPSCSELISLAIVAEDGGHRYFEFEYPAHELTPWLRENVLPYLEGQRVTKQQAAADVLRFIGNDMPEFWCYYGAYDWYWFCRLFGGFMNMPQHWPQFFNELLMLYPKGGIPNVHGSEHNALNDARSIMSALSIVLPQHRAATR